MFSSVLVDLYQSQIEEKRFLKGAWHSFSLQFQCCSLIKELTFKSLRKESHFVKL